jgi:hypothetical protein
MLLRLRCQTRVRSQLADIKKVEADFKVSMKQLDVDLVKIAAVRPR